ncbi:MAG: 4Fe-4S dicluster domain-containing protein, partial [Bacteroidota bacterium]
EFFELPVVDALSDQERVETATKGASRRDFLKYLGFGLGAATIAASCEIPIKKGVPYVVKPDKIVPGVATYYASTFVKGGDVCPIIVKTREGRPIKIEGNRLSEMVNGGSSARVQASVLELYDVSRIRSAGKVKETYNRRSPIDALTWGELDELVKQALGTDSRIAIVSNTVSSPSLKQAIADFIAAYPNAEHVVYDAISSAAILKANEVSFGAGFGVLPNYHFDQAQTVFSFGADFLGTWISPVEFAADWTKNRRIKNLDRPELNRMYYAESGMSLTGSNADNRILIKPSEQGLAIATLYNEVAKLAGGNQISVSGTLSHAKAQPALVAAAKDLWENKGKGVLVISGSNNTGEQILINATNNLLGAYGTTIDFDRPSYQRQGNEADIQVLLGKMKNSAIDAIFFLDECNPVYDLPNGEEFKAALANVNLKVSMSTLPNETLAACTYAAPTPHWLEAWGDAEPKKGLYLLGQPTISPLFETRDAGISLLEWTGNDYAGKDAEQPYLDYVSAYWEQNVFTQANNYQRFQTFWDESLHNGFYKADAPAVAASFAGDVNAAAAKVSKPISGEDIEVSFYESIGLGAGQYANNPWLQEMPDPVTRAVWDNFILIPIKFDGNRRFVALNSLKSGDYADLSIGERTVQLPVIEQFGQMQGTVSVALGYGRTVSGRAGTGVGKNIFPDCWYDEDGHLQYYGKVGVSVSGKKGEDKEFASVQYHHTMGLKEEKDGDNVDEIALMTLGKGFQESLTKRSIIRTANLPELKEKVNDLVHEREHHQKLNVETLYPGHESEYSKGHHWGLVIDLTSCIGCGACQVACMAENNVPVVGKKEVHRHHEMTWLRIDRYFYGDAENPNTVYQPMMCQHCDNAPCENVCPVGATNHSSEGLNQMTYNRCIGTRYCANNCPYKVRRFNWLDYTTADIFPWNESDPLRHNKMDKDEAPFYGDHLTRMVLNPDVTVRSRGVIEKCSFCVQRLQEAKLTAKVEKRRLRDSDLVSACMSACPTGGIWFGDLNDKESGVSKAMKSPLNYKVLEETNVAPSVGYYMKVTNKNEQLG